MTVCVALIEGCSHCDLERDFLVAEGHDCGVGALAGTMSSCEVERDMRGDSERLHQASHKPRRCDRCRAVVADQMGRSHAVVESCRVGWCTRWLCPSCGHEIGSAGPVGCPACDDWTRSRFVKMRSNYRRRRRFW